MNTYDNYLLSNFTIPILPFTRSYEPVFSLDVVKIIDSLPKRVRMVEVGLRRASGNMKFRYFIAKTQNAGYTSLQGKTHRNNIRLNQAR